MISLLSCSLSVIFQIFKASHPVSLAISQLLLSISPGQWLVTLANVSPTALPYPLQIEAKFGAERVGSQAESYLN